MRDRSSQATALRLAAVAGDILFWLADQILCRAAFSGHRGQL